MATEKVAHNSRPHPVGVRLQPDQIEQISAAAKKAGITPHAFMRRAILDAVEKVK